MAQSTDVEIDISKHLTTEDGLSHFGVTTVIEDHNGLIWVGTFKGLNIYDGYEFKTFYADSEIGSLTSSRIQSLLQDSNGNILIGTEKGLTLYDYDKEKFVELYSNSKKDVKLAGPIINQIDQTNQFIVCITESEGVLLFNKNNYDFVGQYMPEGVDLARLKIHGADVLTDRYFLMTTNIGLMSFDTQKKAFERVLPNEVRRCLDVVHGKEGYIYVLSTWELYVISVDFDRGVPKFTLLKSRLGGQGYAQLGMDNEGRLWMRRHNNVISMIERPYRLLNNNYEWINYTFKDEFTRISCIVINTASGGWIGSYNQGLFRFRTNERIFKYSNLKVKEEDDKNKSSQIINMIGLDSTRVLLTINVNTCKVFDTKTGKTSDIGPSEELDRFFTRVYKDTRNTIWLGSRSPGIYRQFQGKSTWELLSHPDIPQLEELTVRSFAEDRHGKFWIADFRGLHRLTIGSKGEIRAYESMHTFGDLTFSEALKINVIDADPLTDVIWIGTVNDGLIKVNYDNEKPLTEIVATNFIPDPSDENSFPGYYVTSIKRLPNQGLWMGTLEGGISKLIEDGEEPKFKSYKETDGLDDNDVMTFQCDEEGNIWIATNQGINELNIDTETFRNYTPEDGLVPASFEVNSVWLDNGLMVFGGNNGVCYFDPKEVPRETFLPKLLFGQLKIHNQLVSVDSKVGTHVVLTQPLNDTKKLELDYDQSSISLELISMHFSNTESHQIRYRLLPLNEKWFVSSSNNKLANFSLLPTGKYTFEAAVSNSKNEWSSPRRIQIIIHPPLWKTGWAYLLYVIVTGVIVFLIMRTLIRMSSLHHRLKVEQMEKDRVVEIDAARIKLFMNISHEFRTPLTLISGPIAVLKNMFKNNQDAFQHIDLVQRQSKKMLQLVEQVHDLRKGEQNLLKLHMQSFDFTDFISEVKHDFEELAQDSNKKLILKGEANQLFVIADKQKLEVVVNNLLNNAFKFTKEGDTICIAYGIREEGFYIEVSDTGRGIRAEDLAHLFERFYQTSKEDGFSVGSGIGLELSKMLVELHFGEIQVTSEYGKGANFFVSLPVKVSKEDAFRNKRMEEILANESHEDKQRVNQDKLDLSDLVVDESMSSVSIYYVEDNYDLRTFVEGVLSEYFNVTSFDNGKKCVEAMDSEWPDLIISDILMPEMNGLELCKHVKVDIRTSHIPVVLLTSRSTTDDKIEGLEMGADAYIVKPFEMRHLIATVQSILQNRQKIRERFKLGYPLSLEKKQYNQNDKIFIERIYRLMEDNLDNESMDLEAFSRELYMSRSQLFRKVKAITNHTPQELIRSYRLKKAAELLAAGVHTVQQVCYKTGFKNRAYFTKVFKEQFGVNPSKYTGS
ncbi:response regulator [Reichenbachiella carrageenanivorans]|uniref:histidine kinase n=1 Tax=Reichenbachiella carrageenanivorans TaxID=2979869 RepID=A0ABY6D2R4_9BACT|nr:hybrid sensor histidine kinase/response regulator transcription factor [Reichenbachiella carrageenanivorans]UXX79383.1 response regulator [Reichenbachiella carrageenanivorans]